jgi:hypothetical protein
MARSVPSRRPASDADWSDAGSFFNALAAAGSLPILRGESGTLRFDLRGGPKLERWYVTVADGVVTASRRGGHVDTVVRMDRPLFDQIIRGTQNAMASQLRGSVDVEGDLHLMMVFQRLFPGPPSSTGRRDPIEGRTVTARIRR